MTRASLDFTVLMAVYAKDDAELFERAINSVFTNSVVPSSLTLVVDGPVPPAIEQKIQSASSTHPISTVRIENNIGLARALNAGLQTINNEWTFRADADDINRSNRFELQIGEIIREPSLVITGGYIEEHDPHSGPYAIREVPLSHHDIAKQIAKRNPFNHMTVAFRTTAVKMLGGYPNVHLKEDYALWASICGSQGNMSNIPHILVDATAGQNMIDRRGGYKYVLSEIEIQKHLVNLSLKTKYQAILHGMLRSSVFMAPSLLRRQVYRLALRKNLQKEGS